MNEEILDRLIKDQALGELSPDIDALMKAYCESEPLVQQRVAETRQTVALARTVLRPRHPLPLPELKLIPFPSNAGAFNSVRRSAGWAIGMAAALVLGIWLGADRTRPSPTSVPTPVVAQAETAPATEPALTFWTVAMLNAHPDNQDSFPRPSVKWTSPVRPPKITRAQ